MRRKLIGMTIMLLTGILLSTVDAQAAPVTLDVPVVSKYVWRGLEANKELVLQPSMTVDLPYGLSFNLWGNMDLTGYGEEAGYGNRSGEFTEIDLTGSGSYSLGPVAMTGGIISYIFPVIGIAKTTHELFLTVSGDVISKPSLSWFSDVDEIKGSYFLFSLAHSIGLDAAPLKSVDLGLTAGYGSGSYNRGYFGVDKAAPVDLVATLSLPLGLESVTITPSVAYIALLDTEIQTARDATGYVVAALKAGFSF
jgi:hypothetical protein